jgi:hypothetical protein
MTEPTSSSAPQAGGDETPVASKLAEKCERLAEWEPCDCGCPGGKAPKSAKDVALIQAAAALRRRTPAAAAGVPIDELHQRIMNLPTRWANGTIHTDDYLTGHRDARHAAAELVSAVLSAGAPAVPLPVALPVQAQEAYSFEPVGEYILGEVKDTERGPYLFWSELGRIKLPRISPLSKKGERFVVYARASSGSDGPPACDLLYEIANLPAHPPDFRGTFASGWISGHKEARYQAAKLVDAALRAVPHQPTGERG